MEQKTEAVETAVKVVTEAAQAAESATPWLVFWALVAVALLLKSWYWWAKCQEARESARSWAQKYSEAADAGQNLYRSNVLAGKALMNLHALDLDLYKNHELPKLKSDLAELQEGLKPFFAPVGEPENESSH